MDITNDKKIRLNPIFINEQSVYYLLASATGLFGYAILTRICSAFMQGLPASLLGAICTASLYFCVANRFVFQNKNRKLLAKLPLFALECLWDGGIYYLLTDALPGHLNITREVCVMTAIAIILILNYYFSSFFIFKSNSFASSRISGKLFRHVVANRYVLLSGATAAFIMLFVYFCYNAYPFGDITILRMDLYHQYGPLFGELYDRLQNGQGLIYSWVSGGGSSFLGNFFNYLSSPFSLLVLLFDRNQVPGAISIIILIKAVLAAMSFTLYLKLSKKSTSFLTAGFGLLYAFCGFFLAYYWNVMWIDALYLLPMVVYGIESIIERQKTGLYIAALILMMFSNYYMSFILCIFSVLYFLAFYFANHTPGEILISTVNPSVKKSFGQRLWNQRFVRSGILFAAGSLFAAAVAAAALLPTYFALQSSSATSGTFPTTLSIYFDLFDFLGNHLPGIETTIRSSGGDVLPNIYSGLIVLILVPLYMMNRSIRTREKIANVVLLVILTASFNTNILNYIWHAFHFPNDLPYRFSFLYTFVLLTMAFRVLTKMKAIHYRDIMLVGMLVLLFVTLVEKMPNKYYKDNMTLYVSIAFTLLYAGILTLVKKKTLAPTIISFLLFLTMGVEIIVGSTDSYVLSQKYENYAGDLGTYQKLLDKIELYENGSADKPRTELFHLRTRMDPCWYGYNGMSTFSSMAYEKMSALQYNLGMAGNRINSYTYNPQTPVYNAMFALKYFIATDQTPNSTYYTKLFTDGSQKYTVYENKYYLPLGFCVDATIDNWYFAEGDPFAVQNSFVRNASGIDHVFEPIPADVTSRINVKDFLFSGNSSFNYEKYGESDASIMFEVTPQQDGNVYLYLSSRGAENATVVSDRVNLTYDFNQPYILDAGYHQAGETLLVTVTLNDTLSSSLSFYSYTLNHEAFEGVYDYLKETAYQITDSSDTAITGAVTAKRNSVLYTSIPYDEGWQAYVDGKRTDTFTIGDALLGIQVSQGTHTVEFRYTPKGLKTGVLISGVAILGAAGYWGLYRKRLRKRKGTQFTR